MSIYARISSSAIYKNMQKLIDKIDNTPQLSPKKVVWASLFSAVIIAAAGAFVVPKIYADTLQDQIEQLTAEANRDQTAVDTLLVEAKSYEDAINSLQAQIAVLEQNIAVNQARQEDLQKQISAKQKELDAQRKVLGDDIKAMYVNDQLSTIEMLATSKNLNDFVDSATYREAVQRKIQTTLAEVAKLQNQLQEQKLEVDKLLAAQRVQQNQLATDRARHNELLAYNESQRLAFNEKIKANHDKITELQAKQAALNLQGATKVNVTGNERGGACDGGSGNGGYALASGAMGNVCEAPKDSILDWAGIENRECTSYAYWFFKRVAGNADFTASGDAKYWVTTSNYPVHNWPKVNAIGVKTEGQWGHVVIVQAVGPSNYKGVNVPAGQVLTSEMNADFTGRFSYNLRGIGTMSYIYK
jgi:peptidoglycan DL-endopeptidase CwlO